MRLDCFGRFGDFGPHALETCSRWGKGGIPKVVPPLLPKGTLEAKRRAVWERTGRTLYSTGICVFLFFFYDFETLGYMSWKGAP